MTRFRIPAVLVAAVLSLAPALGLAGPVCLSCCPEANTGAPTITSLACCGQDCTPRLTSSEERPCLASGRLTIAKWELAATTAVFAFSPLPRREEPDAAPFWLPTAARPGSSPLRL